VEAEVVEVEVEAAEGRVAVGDAGGWDADVDVRALTGTSAWVCFDLNTGEVNTISLGETISVEDDGGR
jgi:hypothetical protein